MQRVSKALLVAICLLMSFCTIVSADQVTSADVSVAVQQAQCFLFNQQEADGHFRAPAIEGAVYPLESYSVQRDYSLATACMVVSGLLETGVSASDVHVQKAIGYILSFWNEAEQKFVPQEAWEETYDTGVILMALSLFGSISETEEEDFPGFRSKVQAAYDHLVSFQHNEDNGITSGDVHYGGWTYLSGSFGFTDLSNTQYAALGLWYASRYLGYSMDEAEWADRLLVYVTRCHGWDETNDQPWADGKDDPSLDGAFSYVPNGESFYPGGCQTGAGLWSLAMIGEDQNPMVDVAIDWFRHNYTWSRIPGSYYDSPTMQKMGYYYFVYGMGKSLTGLTTPDEVISGDQSWTQDLLDVVIPEKVLTSGDIVSDDQVISGDVCYWPAPTHRDGNDSIATSFVLMTLAFINPSTESSEKHLAQPDDMDNPIQGKVTIKTSGEVTISDASRENASSDEGDFPIGAFNFTLNHVPDGGVVVVRLELPAEGFNPDDPSSFVDSEGAPKGDLCWMGRSGIVWSQFAGVVIDADIEGQYIEITLTDNGPGDSDDIPGQITVSSSAPGLFRSDGSGSIGRMGGCQVSAIPSSMMLLVPLILLFRK